jgi:hypothetical protein
MRPMGTSRSCPSVSCERRAYKFFFARLNRPCSPSTRPQRIHAENVERLVELLRPTPGVISLHESIQQIKSAYEANDFARCASLCRPMLSRPPRPINTGVAICYGKSLLQLDRRCDEALPYLRRAARQCPREPERVWADAQTFLAVALASSGEFAEAEAVLRAFASARLQSPASVGALQAHAILAVADDWRRGWSLHESRRHNPAVVVGGVDVVPRWDGADSSSDIAIIDEQGLDEST